VLVSSVDGAIVTSQQLTEKSKLKGGSNIVFTNPATVGDFNNDGLNDVIIIANTGLYGYTTQKGAGSVLFPVIVLALMSVMAYLLVQNEGGNQDHSRRGVKKRATD